MITSDFVVLTSCLLIAIAVFSSSLKHRKGKTKTIPGKLIALSFAVLFLGFVIEDTRLAKSLVSGIIIGSLLQSLLADPYLTKRVLRYKEEGWFFISTPWWMMLLWGIAVTHLVYFYLRTIERPFTNLRQLLLILAGLSYFFIFELVTNNLTFWWQRKNCLQVFKVAFYAIYAELLTISILVNFSLELINNSLEWRYLIFLSLLAGVGIAVIFDVLCAALYEKQLSN